VDKQYVARLRAEDATLVVIDMQEGFRPIIPDFEEIADRVGRLMEAARIMEIPLLVSEQYPKGLKATVECLQGHVSHAKAVVPKVSFSCWGAEEFQAHLAATGRRQVVLCGVETHICVMQTALDLLEQGFEVFVVHDGCGSRFPVNKRAGLRRLARSGATVCTFEMVLFEWLRTAACPQFKAVQSLVR